MIQRVQKETFRFFKNPACPFFIETAEVSFNGFLVFDIKGQEFSSTLFRKYLHHFWSIAQQLRTQIEHGLAPPYQAEIRVHRL